MPLSEECGQFVLYVHRGEFTLVRMDPMATSIRYFFKVSTSWHGVEQDLFSPAIFVLVAASSPQKLSKCVARCVPACQEYEESWVQLELRPTAGLKTLPCCSGCKCEDDE